MSTTPTSEYKEGYIAGLGWARTHLSSILRSDKGLTEEQRKVLEQFGSMMWTESVMKEVQWKETSDNVN